MNGVEDGGQDEKNGYDGENGQFFVDWLIQLELIAGGPDSNELEEIVDEASNVNDLYTN